MKRLFEDLANLLRQGENAMLVTVVASNGSAPAGLGARMLVGKNGRRIGTIGGGAVEHKAEQLAVQALAEGKSRIEAFELHQDAAGELGMVCGGTVGVYFQFVPAGAAAVAFAQRCAACFEKDENAWLLCRLGGTGADMALYTQTGGLLPLAGGWFVGRAAKAFEALLGVQPCRGQADGQEIYCEPLVRAGRAVVFGGGHVSQALVPLLGSIGFRTLVVEDRPDFATKELFPTADVLVVDDYADLTVALTENDYLILLTRGHAGDFEIQRQVLRSPHAYVGVIGSRAKIKLVGQKLRQAGISQAAISSVHTPIGLDIGAKTPAEIAVSIAAELIQVRVERER